MKKIIVFLFVKKLIRFKYFLIFIFFMIRYLTFLDVKNRRSELEYKLKEMVIEINIIKENPKKDRKQVEALLSGAYILRRLLKRSSIDIEELYEEFVKEYVFNDKKIFYDGAEMFNKASTCFLSFFGFSLIIFISITISL